MGGAGGQCQGGWACGSRAGGTGRAPPAKGMLECRASAEPVPDAPVAKAFGETLGHDGAAGPGPRVSVVQKREQPGAPDLCRVSMAQLPRRSYR